MPTPSSRHAFEPSGVDGNDPNLLQLGMFQEIARPRIMPVRVDENLQDGLRLMAQFGDDRVESVNVISLGHCCGFR
jgi:hypothetical protein